MAHAHKGTALMSAALLHTTASSCYVAYRKPMERETKQNQQTRHALRPVLARWPAFHAENLEDTGGWECRARPVLAMNPQAKQISVVFLGEGLETILLALCFTRSGI